MSEQSSPVGATVVDHIEKSHEDSDFRAEYDRLRPYEEFARIVIARRAALGLTQAELAARMGTTDSVVSRIESGQHAPTLRPSRSSPTPSASEPCSAEPAAPSSRSGN